MHRRKPSQIRGIQCRASGSKNLKKGRGVQSERRDLLKEGPFYIHTKGCRQWGNEDGGRGSSFGHIWVKGRII